MDMLGLIKPLTPIPMLSNRKSAYSARVIQIYLVITVYMIRIVSTS